LCKTTRKLRDNNAQSEVAQDSVCCENKRIVVTYFRESEIKPGMLLKLVDHGVVLVIRQSYYDGFVEVLRRDGTKRLINTLYIKRKSIL
jgi:hypothetical protein